MMRSILSRSLQGRKEDRSQGGVKTCHWCERGCQAGCCVLKPLLHDCQPTPPHLPSYHHQLPLPPPAAAPTSRRSHQLPLPCHSTHAVASSKRSSMIASCICSLCMMVGSLYETISSLQYSLAVQQSVGTMGSSTSAGGTQGQVSRAYQPAAAAGRVEWLAAVQQHNPENPYNPDNPAAPLLALLHWQTHLQLRATSLCCSLLLPLPAPRCSAS